MDITQQGDEMAASFIAGANRTPEQPEKKIKQPIVLRFDPALLDKVDKAARHRGISRSSWIQYVVSRSLDNGEG
ncbi:hypothetical protein [Candidatus Magnetaquicoccus inordinatus]|uniref:hypothetical protein n=1 Tax=Candidatus Magnetaquicoccus inordinatus TaxID=2496818 RepID=UPI00102CACFF|nr:hypothetical protein [Candidatus Magnetaquicoccus inordinatus]